MITRGTTPLITIKLPFEAAELNAGEIRCGQAGRVLFVRSLAACTAEADTLSLFLTEEETLMLDALAPIEAQIIAQNQNGVIVASEIMTDEVGRLLEM